MKMRRCGRPQCVSAALILGVGVQDILRDLQPPPPPPLRWAPYSSQGADRSHVSLAPPQADPLLVGMMWKKGEGA